MGESERRANQLVLLTIHLDETAREDVEFAVSDWLTDIRADPRPVISESSLTRAQVPVSRSREYASRVRKASPPLAGHMAKPRRGFSGSGIYLLCEENIRLPAYTCTSP